MKINKILSICMTAALLSSSCSDDLGLQPGNEPVAGKGQIVRIEVSLGDKDSRLGYDEQSDAMNITWDKYDTLKVVAQSSPKTIHYFKLVEGEGTASGVFESVEEVAFAAGDTLYTLYHNTLIDAQINNDGNIDITLPEQTGELNADCQLMFGRTICLENNLIQGVELKHLGSILKVNIPTDKTLKSVTFKGRFYPKATLVLQNRPALSPSHFQSGDLVYCKSDENSYELNELTANGTFEPNSAGEVNVYFYALSTKGYWNNEEGHEDPNMQPSISVVDVNDVEYVNAKTFGFGGIASGKMYNFSTGIFKPEKFENENIADGSEEKPYVIATTEQFYTWIIRCTRDSGYDGLHYKLAKDIELDGSLDWKNFWFNGSLDGCGHKISGPIINGLFDTLNGTVSNLTLDLDVTINNMGSVDYGCLALRASGATIVNCVNESDVTAPGLNSGGLVGAMEYGAKMIACVNKGDITLMDDYSDMDDPQMVGGLVGSLRYGAYMEACYSTGSIIVLNNATCTGGLVGSLNYWQNDEYDKSYMTGCWSSSSYKVQGKDELTLCAVVGWVEDNVEDNMDCVECHAVASISDLEANIDSMNEAMTNGKYMFGADGTIVPIAGDKPSTSLPEIEVEDF